MKTKMIIKKSAFDRALLDAKAILDNLSATQKQINDAKRTLEDAKNQLTGQLNRAPLKTLIAEAESLKGNHRYYNETETMDIAAFNNALNDAKEIVDRDVPQKSLNNIANILEAAINDLDGNATDLMPLRELVLEGESVKNKPLYENEMDLQRKLSFDVALDEAKAILQEPLATQVEVNSARQNLETAKNQLTGVINRTPLQKLIMQAEALKDTNSYYNETTSTDIFEFKRALDYGRHIVDSDVSQKTLDDSEAVLRKAMEKIDGEETNFEGLRALVEYSNQLKENVVYINEKTESEKTGFIVALEAAKVKLGNPKVPQYEIDQTYQVLNSAKERLDGEELEEKKIEFRNVSKAKLYKIVNGNLTLISGLPSAPQDKENYVVKLVNEGTEIILPVYEFVVDGEKVNAIVRRPHLNTYNNQEGTFEENYKISVDKIILGEGIYTDFNQLITDMKNNPTKEFKIGSDLVATEALGETYVNGAFRGKLKSVDGKRYSIISLKKPLFNELSNAVIDNISFKDVNIIGTRHTATIALTANNSTISNLDVRGRIEFKPNRLDTRYIGGLVATGSNATLSKNYVDLEINAVDKSSGQIVGGLMGRLAFGTIEKNIIKGTLVLTEPKNSLNSKVSAIVGGEFNANIRNNAVNMQVSHNTNPYMGTGIVRDFNETKETQLRQEWGFENYTINDNSDVGMPTSFVGVEGYSQDKELAYKNIAKLLPLYDKKTIVKEGNKLHRDSIFLTNEIEALVTMSGNRFNPSYFDKE